jgi:hypothetical protein
VPDSTLTAARPNASDRYDRGQPSILLEHGLSPMDAVNALYSEQEAEIAEAIVASLSHQVFDAEIPEPASRLRRRMAGGIYRLLKRTTRQQVRSGPDNDEIVAYHNPILKRTGHPYAMTLLEPSSAQSASFVEGGDPMNAPYMMISPEISQNAKRWDRLLLSSTHGMDVQLRFIWEARATLAAAKRRLDEGCPVQLKAAAAGTGLNLILVFDRLAREGYDPTLITATVTDRCPHNVIKSKRLMSKLATTSVHFNEAGIATGIWAHEEDLLAPAAANSGSFDVVTLVGILEYFHGYTCGTMEEFQNRPVVGDESEAVELIERIGASVAGGGALIANTYRAEIAGRILEIFGKHLRYRNRDDLHQLLATADFDPLHNAGSGHVYDVEVFEKR